MKIITHGDIMDRGRSVFTSVSAVDGSLLKIDFTGVIRVDAPYRHLAGYVDELRNQLSALSIDAVELDFREFTFCNSNGFYVIMDITELVLKQFNCPVSVKRLAHDDWHQETLPILLNADEPSIQQRLTFKDFEEV